MLILFCYLVVVVVYVRTHALHAGKVLLSNPVGGKHQINRLYFEYVYRAGTDSTYLALYVRLPWDFLQL